MWSIDCSLSTENTWLVTTKLHISLSLACYRLYDRYHNDFIRVTHFSTHYHFICHFPCPRHHHFLSSDIRYCCGTGASAHAHASLLRHGQNWLELGHMFIASIASSPCVLECSPVNQGLLSASILSTIREILEIIKAILRPRVNIRNRHACYWVKVSIVCWVPNYDLP